MKQNIGIAAGANMMVRLALLSGMPEDDPSDKDLVDMRLARSDPLALDGLRKSWQVKGAAPLTVAQLNDRLFLYPRRRAAIVKYVDIHEGHIRSVNVEVKTLGSTTMQPAVGHYPEWAMETFRLANVPVFDEEPEDNQDVHVCYPVPKEEGDE